MFLVNEGLGKHTLNPEIVIRVLTLFTRMCNLERK